MKIIKKGKIPKTTERFTCSNCGCVFECEVSECNVTFSQKKWKSCRCCVSDMW